MKMNVCDLFRKDEKTQDHITKAYTVPKNNNYFA